ncbi:YbhB/YbcL family Raf kinase inhibitor-like protein [Agromyces soli]
MRTESLRRPRRSVRRTALVVAAAALGGAALLPVLPASAVDGGIEVTSTDMSDGAPLNPLFACSGFPFSGTVSPQLQWGTAPAGTASWVVLMHDELSATPNTSYDQAQSDWAHWGVYNIPVATTSLVRNASATGALGGGTQAANEWNSMSGGEQRYLGPCPPSGDHDYFFTVYALDATITPTPTGVGGAVTTADMLAAMQGHILDQGDLQTTFAQADVGTNRVEVEFADPEAVLAEAGGTASVPKLLVNGKVPFGSSVSVTVELTSTPAAGTSAATLGSDLSFSAPQTQTITIPAILVPNQWYDGTLATAIDVPGLLTAIDDALVEGAESLTFRVSVAAGSNGVAVGDAGHSGEAGGGDGVVQNTVTVRITDDDQAAAVPVIEFASAAASGSEAAPATPPVLLVNGTPDAPVQVTLSVTGGTATAGTDFTAPVTVTIPAGAYDGTTATAVVVPEFAVNGDTLDEADETVVLAIVSGDTAALVVGDANGDQVTFSTATYTIVDDDEAPATPSPEPSPGAGGTTTTPSTSPAPSGGLASTGFESTFGLAAAGGLVIAGSIALIALRLTRRVAR